MNQNSAVNPYNPTVVHLFYQSVVHQLYWIALIGAAAAVVIVLAHGRTHETSVPEHRSRTYLRWAFGIIWIVDGVLQHQGAMPLGLGNDVVAAALPGTPFWLHDLITRAINEYNRFPVALAAAIMWIQLGIGLLLLCSRGRWSRAAAAFSVGWGLLVWFIGNGLAVFAPGVSFLFGWPGAAVFYIAAGLWLAAPPRVFPTLFSKVTLRALSVLFVLAIAVQSWPDHQFWHGGPLNALHAMSLQMSQAPQPSWLARLVLDGGHAGAVIGGGANLIVIFWFATCAVGLWRASTREIRWPIWTTIAGCLVVWVVVQDAAVFGGLSTDLNSMIPLAALVWCAAPARRSAAVITMPVPVASRRSFAIVGAAVGLAMVFVAIVPMVRTSFAAGAETTTYIAENDGVIGTNFAAPAFHAVDQGDHPFSFPFADDRLAVVTFLDPVCWTQCPLLAHQLGDLDLLLTPSERTRVQLIAVAANPDHETLADVRSFIATNGLGSLPNFSFVTGPLATMRAIWHAYGIGVSNEPGQVMSVHSDQMDIVSAAGRVRVIAPDVPGSGAASEESTAAQLRDSLVSAGLGS